MKKDPVELRIPLETPEQREAAKKARKRHRSYVGWARAVIARETHAETHAETHTRSVEGALLRAQLEGTLTADMALALIRQAFLEGARP